MLNYSFLLHRVGCVALHNRRVVHGFLGLLLLLLGTSVYLLDRSWQELAVAAVVPLAIAPFPMFGVLGDNLPSFAHVCAFALLTAALLDGGKRLNQGVCLGWLSVNVAFELGQHPKLAASIANTVPPWFTQLHILNQTPTYFLSGTFDPLDILFAALGALTAYMLMVSTHAPKVRHED